MPTPTAPRNGRTTLTGRTALDLYWDIPVSDGGSPITHYEICVIDPDGRPWPFERTGGATLTWRIRGLAIGHRYGFRLRAVNAEGPGLQGEIFYGIPLRLPVRRIAAGQEVPLLDVDRQSMVLRLDDIDCLLRVWWAPSDNGWWGALEVPVNTVVVSGKRLVLNSGLLDRLPGFLPGNLVMRSLGGDNREPDRAAWRLPSHALVWEAAA